MPPKRTLLTDPPDTGNRVSKPTSTTQRPTRTTNAKALLSFVHSEASKRGNHTENVLSEAHSSTEKEAQLDTGISDEINMIDEMISEDPFAEEPQSPSQVLLTQPVTRPPTPKSQDKDDKKGGAAPLMVAIKGLLDLTNDYLQRLEEQHPGVGADFLAMLADGASRAMRGERVYCITSDAKLTHQGSQDTWAKKAKGNDEGVKVYNVKRQTLKATPPQGQSKEDRRIMIRLGPDHEARKAGSFELRQKIQELVTDKSLVSDVWSVPSGVAILAPTPAQAATLMQSKAAIEERLGNAKVERQEKWSTFIVGPIPKRVRCLDGIRDPMDGLLLEELASVRDAIPIRFMNWTRKSESDDEPFGRIRICVPETRADKFPSRLRIFGEAVSIQRIQQRQQALVCTKCHGFHSTRTCARQHKCATCGTDAHPGPCQKPARCLNCRGPHSSTDNSCPARPRCKNGVLVRPTGSQLQQIRAAGSKEYLKINKQPAPESSQTPAKTMETESQTPLN